MSFTMSSTCCKALSPHAPNAAKWMKLQLQCVPFTPPPVSYEVRGEGWWIGEGLREVDSPLASLATAFDGQNPALGKTEAVLWEVRTDCLIRVQTLHARLTVEVLMSVLTPMDPINLRSHFLSFSPLL